MSDLHDHRTALYLVGHLSLIRLTEQSSLSAAAGESLLCSCWRFHRGDVAGAEAAGFDDGEWDGVSVPHDWAIAGPFDASNDIQRVAIKQDGETYLWLRRKPLLEYDAQTQRYNKRERTPFFEAYLKKQVENSTFAFVGIFVFMRFKFKIVGFWDEVLGRDKRRLNLFVDRLPMEEQSIINGINKRKRNENGKGNTNGC